MSKYAVPDRKFIRPANLRVRYGKFDPNVFRRWRNDKVVRKLRNGVYFNEQYTVEGPWDHACISNELYQPSYVSLISAFRFYNFIPEAVYETTAVSTRKTKSFEVRNARFTYQQLAPKLFFGYETLRWKDSEFAVATPEKALLDYAYLTPEMSDHDYVEEMRFDGYEIEKLVNWELLGRMGEWMGSQAAMNRITVLLDVMDR